jgi:hypothetical protein
VLSFVQKREQLRDHDDRVQRLEAELEDHRRHPPERSAKSLSIQNYKEKDVYLHYEVMIWLFCLLGNAGTDPVSSQSLFSGKYLYGICLTSCTIVRCPFSTVVKS